MSKVFRAWDVDEVWLLPASVQDFVPPGHIAHLIRETVREGLDLRAIASQYDKERGYPPYHPGMMTALLLYAYSQGIYSSRRIDRACHERGDFFQHATVTGLRAVSGVPCIIRLTHCRSMWPLYVKLFSIRGSSKDDRCQARAEPSG